MGPARVGEEQLGPHVGGDVGQGLGHQVEDRLFGLGHLQRPLQATFELVAAGRPGLDRRPWRGTSRSKLRAFRERMAVAEIPNVSPSPRHTNRPFRGVTGVGLRLIGGADQVVGDGLLQRSELIVQVLVGDLLGSRGLCAVGRSRSRGQYRGQPGPGIRISGFQSGEARGEAGVHGQGQQALDGEVGLVDCGGVHHG